MYIPGKKRECGEKQDHQIKEAVVSEPMQIEIGELHEPNTSYCSKGHTNGVLLEAQETHAQKFIMDQDLLVIQRLLQLLST
jgi:hypothetical protein